jgi:hypothetical protein
MSGEEMTLTAVAHALLPMAAETALKDDLVVVADKRSKKRKNIEIEAGKDAESAAEVYKELPGEDAKIASTETDTLVPFSTVCCATHMYCREGFLHVLMDSRQSIEQMPEPGYTRQAGATTDGNVYSFDAACKQVRDNKLCQTIVPVDVGDLYSLSTGRIVRSGSVESPAKCARVDMTSFNRACNELFAAVDRAEVVEPPPPENNKSCCNPKCGLEFVDAVNKDFKAVCFQRYTQRGNFYCENCQNTQTHHDGDGGRLLNAMHLMSEVMEVGAAAKIVTNNDIRKM